MVHIISNALSAMSQRYQERKKAMLRFYRDRLERQLAAVNASLTTLDQQMKRDQSVESEFESES